MQIAWNLHDIDIVCLLSLEHKIEMMIVARDKEIYMYACIDRGYSASFISCLCFHHTEYMN